MIQIRKPEGILITMGLSILWGTAIVVKIMLEHGGPTPGLWYAYRTALCVGWTCMVLAIAIIVARLMFNRRKRV